MKPLNRSHFNDHPIRPYKVLQFGGGNFLRAFADWMFEILNEETDFNGDVILVKPTRGGSYEGLRLQEGIYHVVLQGWQKGRAVTETRRVHCVRKILNPYLEWDDFLESATIPTLRFVVSNTTESGIRYDGSAVREDNPPESFPAKLTRWLYHRYLNFGGNSEKGCVFLPCELIEANGDALKACILKHVNDWQLEPAFREWVLGANYFCNTLVDRIVSGYPTKTAAELHRSLGFLDQQMVAGEVYHNWVIEGPGKLDQWLPFKETALNVNFVADLGPYRDMKVYLLNATHTLMVPVGLLLGFQLVRECMDDVLMRRFLDGLMEEEICTSFNWPAKSGLAYKDSVVERFKNPFVDHRLESIALNSISKLRTRVLPVIHAYYKKEERPPRRVVFAFAALLWLYRGDENSVPIDLKDSAPFLDFFSDAWNDYSGTPRAALHLAGRVLKNTALWEQDLSPLPGLEEHLGRSLYQIGEKGIQQALIDL